MQKIRYNFRQTDSTREMNEHFLAMSSDGVKFGFVVSRGEGLVLNLSPGALMSKEGVSIMETEPVQLTMTACPNSGYRYDVIVAEYLYEEKTEPNACVYKILEGVVGTTNLEFPTINPATQYPIAKLKLAPNMVIAEGHTSIEDIEQIYSMNRVDMEIDAPNYKAMDFDVAYNSNTKLFSLTGSGDVTINKIKSPIPTMTLGNNKWQKIEVSYTVNSGATSIDLGIDELNRTPGRLYIKPNDPETFDLDGINSIQLAVFLTEEDFINNTLTGIDVNLSKIRTLDPVTKKFYVPCKDVFAVSLAEIIGTNPDDLTIGINRIQTLALVGSAAKGYVALKLFCNAQTSNFIDANGFKYAKRRCIPIATLDGDAFTKIVTLGYIHSFVSAIKECGMLRFYHFLGTVNYTLTVMDEEGTEIYNTNSGVTDRTGSFSRFKTKDYASVYYTGADSTKLVECSIHFGGK